MTFRASKSSRSDPACRFQGSATPAITPSVPPLYPLPHSGAGHVLGMHTASLATPSASHFPSVIFRRLQMSAGKPQAPRTRCPPAPPRCAPGSHRTNQLQPHASVVSRVRPARGRLPLSPAVSSLVSRGERTARHVAPARSLPRSRLPGLRFLVPRQRRSFQPSAPPFTFWHRITRPPHHNSPPGSPGCCSAGWEKLGTTFPILLSAAPTSFAEGRY